MSKPKGTIYRAILTKHHDDEHGDMWQCLFMFSDGKQKAMDVTDIRGAANEIWMIEEAELAPHMPPAIEVLGLDSLSREAPQMVTDLADGETEH